MINKKLDKMTGKNSGCLLAGGNELGNLFHLSTRLVFICFLFVLFSFSLMISGCGRTGFSAGGGVVPEVCTDYPRIVDYPDQAGLYSSLTFDRYNIPHIAYYDFLNKGILKYAQAITSQTTCGWDIATVDDQGDDNGQYPNVFIGEDGLPRIIYFSFSQDAVLGIKNELRFAQKIPNPDGTGTFIWQKTGIDASGYRGLFATAVMDASHLYHIITLNTKTMDLEYAYFDGTNPAVFEPAVSLAGYDVSDVQVSIAVTPGAVPIIAFHHPKGELWVLQRSSAPPNAGAWQISVVETNVYGDDRGRYVSLAVDGQGLPHLCYFIWKSSVSTKHGELWYGHFNGASWQKTVVDKEGMTGANCSIALNASSRPLISYLNSSNNDLKVAFLRDAVNMRWDTWSVDYSLATGYASDLAVSSVGNVGVSYYDFSLQGLKFYWIGFY
ncbi:MAG: hypothetical protein PHE84_06020 [bacterium]|nr:hypothetical protein [bacterium]